MDMPVRSKDIAAFLSKELKGLDRKVIKPCSLNQSCAGGLVFAKKYDEEILEKLSMKEELTAIVTPEYKDKLVCSYILSNNPRLDFALAVQKFFVAKIPPKIADTAILGKNVSLGKDVTIGEYSVIGDNVVIGDRTVIRHNVVINEGAIIGSDCLIKSNSVIGEEGFGFERDEQGRPIRIPHLGKVVIGNQVEIGASTVIARGTIDNTTIQDNVKIDDKVFIAHNVAIGKNSMVIAEAEISGSAIIGANSWLGPNACVLNGISIGENCFIGLGTVVNKPLPDNVVAVGNPARVLRENSDISKAGCK
jgi:UDP-3-O-[3-hydroxymyristoyl] glucosamine N-acyltransferase